jgi:Protein of unknown function (DUF1353)
MADPRFVGVLSLSSYVGPVTPFGEMVLDQDFAFIDSNSVTWDAHKGDIIGGAHIPAIFKPLMGTSYETPYLGAAVLHDVWCRSMKRTWQSTDAMFYEAMVTNGLNIVKAYSMWSAVYFFGPHW